MFNNTTLVKYSLCNYSFNIINHLIDQYEYWKMLNTRIKIEIEIKLQHNRINAIILFILHCICLKLY